MGEAVADLGEAGRGVTGTGGGAYRNLPEAPRSALPPGGGPLVALVRRSSCWQPVVQPWAGTPR
jgi:hypothetical protein